MTPMDDDNEALISANSLLAKRREMKRHYAAPAIRSGQCKGCDLFTSLVHGGDYCIRCNDEVSSVPEPITFAPHPIEEPKHTGGYWRKEGSKRYGLGFLHGFLTALACVAVITGLLLWGHK